MSETTTLENRLQAVSDTTTEADLAALKEDIAGCIAPERLESLRSIVDAKDNIKTETKTKLQSLLVECQASPEKPTEIKSSFDRVFTGARSMAFSEANRKTVQASVSALLKLDEYPHITVVRRENILLAMTDRLLKDKDFQGIFNTSLWFADIAGNIVKWDYAQAADGASKTQAQDLEGRIGLCIARVTEPLSKLLAKEKDTPKMLAFLSNPQIIADFNGGEMPSGTDAITKENLESYIESLNGQILKIDKKIFPLETIREQGMDALANAPSTLKDIFRWMLELPLIGKMLAMFLGYKDQKEASESIDEELRQRKSLSVLREFGDITPPEGWPSRGGKYAGKISILKGQDLSKLSRKKLAPFFSFTASEGIDATNPDFWIRVFEKGEIIKKDEKGAEMKYTLEKSIRSDDLNKDFDGLYAKLNKLHDIVDDKKRKAYDDDKRHMLATATETPTVPEKIKPLTLTEIGTLPTIEKLTPEVRKQIVIGNPKDWGIILPKVTDLSYVAKIAKEVATVDQFCKNNPTFMKALRKESGSPIVTLEDVWQFKDRAVALVNKQTPLTIPAQKSTPNLAKAPETPKDEKTLLVEAFNTANNLPFEFGPDKTQVSFEGGRLKIGAKEFALTLSNGTMEPKVSSITLVGPDVRLWYLAFTKEIKRSQITEGIPGLMTMEPNTTKDIPWEEAGQKLIVKRVA